MEDYQDAEGIQQFHLQNSVGEMRTFPPTIQSHHQSDVATSQVQLFPTVQPSQHNIADEGQQPGQQTHSIRTLQGPSPHGEAFQETPDVKPHLLVDDGNEQDPDVGAFQLHPVVWPLQGQQNLSPPLALAQHNPAVQPSSQNAAVLQNPAVPPGVVQNSVTDTGTDWCRERVVTQNKRQPSATNSTAQTTGSDGTITVTDRGVLPLWQTVGEWKNLATDSDIARFLLSLYFNPKLAEIQSDSRCVHCSTPLTMCCITCLLSAKQPAPSQSSSHLSQTSYTQGRHGKSQDLATSEDEMKADSLCGNDSEEDAEGHASVSDVEMSEDTSWETQARSQWNMTTTPVVVLRGCHLLSTTNQPMNVNKKTARRPQTKRRGARSSNQSQTSGLEKDCAVATNKKRALDGRNVRNARLEAESVPKKTRRQSVESLRHRGSARPGGETEDIASSDPLKGDLGSANSTASLKHETESHSTGSTGSLSVKEETEREKYPICDGIPFRNGDIPAYKQFSEYRCSRCDRTFKYKHLLKRHMKNPKCDVDEECVQKPKTKRCASPKPANRESDDDLSDSHHAVERSSHSKADKKEKRFRLELPKECTIEEFMMGMIQIPTGFQINGSSRKRTVERYSHYTCEQCYKVFVQRRTYKSHQKEHLKEKEEGTSQSHTEPERKGPDPESLRILTEIKERLLHCCPHCNQIFTSKVQHRNHVRSHTHSVNEDGMYTCQFCEAPFKSFSLLNEHLRVRTTKTVCPQCGERFKARCIIKRHMKAHKEENKIKCQVCGESFDGLTKVEINRHLKTHKEMRLTALCPVCGESVPRKRLAAHTRTHSEQDSLQCTVCNKTFKTHAILEVHKLIHGAKAFQCETCGEYFHRSGDLKRHRAYRHLGHVFECNECGKRLSKRHVLERHINVVHRKVKPYVCSFCGLGHNSKVKLDVHLRSHTGEKPYQCPHCPSKFARRPYLKVHVRTHTGERPYGCEDCGQTFACYTSIMLHRRNHHSDKVFPCAECGETFRLQNSLDYHCYNVHGANHPSMTEEIPSTAAEDNTPELMDTAVKRDHTS